MRARLPAAIDLPPMEPTVVVVGDVHLSPERPDVAARFEAFLEGLSGKAKTLVLLGDVFDYWVGKKQAGEALPRRTFDRLKALAASGTRLAFLGGNRDYVVEAAEGTQLRVLAPASQNIPRGSRVHARLPVDNCRILVA